MARQTSSASQKVGKMKVISCSAKEIPWRDQVFAKQPSFCLPNSCQPIPLLAEITQKLGWAVSHEKILRVCFFLSSNFFLASLAKKWCHAKLQGATEIAVVEWGRGPFVTWNFPCYDWEDKFLAWWHKGKGWAAMRAEFSSTELLASFVFMLVNYAFIAKCCSAPSTVSSYGSSTSLDRLSP